MEYCIVEDGVIVNMIVAEADFAGEIGALPAYEGAAIGGAYTPPPPEPEPPTTDERVTKLETENSKLKSQLQMQAQQQEFLENCLLEMGDVVYA
jgi:hypothetical protein|nr:MAG TPA: hypothetical protein [Caudoviricetes sp.]